MMRYTTNALPADVRDIAPEARHVEREYGITTFSVDERHAAVVLSELKRAGYSATGGRPRHVSYSSPNAYMSASSHIRRF